MKITPVLELAAVLRDLTDGVTVQAADGSLVFANEAVARLLGLSDASELERVPVGDCMQRFSMFDAETGAPLAPADLPGRIVLGGAPHARRHIRYLDRVTGAERWSLVNSNAITGPDGERFAINVTHDTTAEKRREQRAAFLANASQLLSSSLDHQTVLSAIVRLCVPTLADFASVDVLDEHGALRRLELCFRESGEELRLKAGMREFSELRESPVRQALARGARVSFDAATASPEDYAWVKGASTNLQALVALLAPRAYVAQPLISRGRTLGVLSVVQSARWERRFTEDDLATLTDLAQRAAIALDNARLYRKAEIALRAREDALTVVSHELKNALSVIMVNANTAARACAGCPEGSFRLIHDSAEQMSRLVGELLELARMEAGRVALKRTEHPVGLLVGLAREQMALLAEQKGITLDEAVEDPELALMLDREMLLRVFMNLISNAIRFTGGGGRISLSARREEGHVRFGVVDSGQGIPPEHLPHVFDRYWHVRQSEGGQNGLGLAIAKGIVEAHGGRIWAESTLGEGSRIWFTVPLSPAVQLRAG